MPEMTLLEFIRLTRPDYKIQPYQEKLLTMLKENNNKQVTLFPMNVGRNYIRHMNKLWKNAMLKDKTMFEIRNVKN